ncbi:MULTISPECIES: endo-1,4-beta-xylanase [Metabacillus]|uniref:Beta-xylanase n=2 Tax=Metabacillus TaxID=2675233 RepID=A0A179T763_9BACI|nr:MULTISPECIES: endo-1,4-beta-xylanase [Metabacillus]OAS89220.1 1,4-beta-xylanase [Metabacillus litoralis]QNF28733.1 endo-1,4-beta-xylanase [Metabacillus sp. KUDC1714]
MSQLQSKLNIPSFSDVYSDCFSIGAAINQRTIESSKQLLTKHFNSITAENDMKPENLQPEENKFTFEKADQFVAFAEEHKMKMRGHTLVWHNQTPDWMFTTPDGSVAKRDLLLDRMQTHISTVVGRYKGRIHSWDVVNEVIDDSENLFLRKSNYLDIVGEDFIEKSFRFAHEADPKALLFYNDYNESHPQKRDKIYKLVKSLLKKDVPLHGIGMQAHWNLTSPTLDNIRAAIEKYASLGLQIQLTELDVSVFDTTDRRTDLKEPTTEMVALQEERYEQLFALLREYRDVISCVTFWGVADDYTWLDNFPVRGRKNWPLLFDDNQLPKQAFHKITSFK